MNKNVSQVFLKFEAPKKKKNKKSSNQNVKAKLFSKATFFVIILTLLGLGLIKINDVSANFNNPRPSLILNN